METEPAKRIFIVVPSLVGGGAERMVVNLCRALDRQAFRPTLVTFTEQNDYAGELPGDVRRINLGKQSRFDNLLLPLRLARVLRRERPDLLFSRLHFSSTVALLARELSRCRTPLVVTVDTTLSRSLTQERFSALRRVLTRRLFQRIERIIPVSDGVMEDLLRNFDIAPAQCTVLPNGIDVGRVREMIQVEPAHHWFREEPPVLVSVGRLSRVKNYPLLLEAFADVAQSRPARLVLVGQGEEREHLERLAEELGVRGSVEFMGFQANPFAFVGAADVFVLSSHWEGFGNVLVEAMACGTAVISTRTHGAEAIVADGEDGLLVPCGDRDALSAAICRMLDDGRLRENLSRSAAAKALQFDNARVTRRYEQVFEEVLRARN